MKTTAAAILSLGLFLGAPAQEATPRIHFNRDIRPLLADACWKCHGPDTKANTSGVRLDTRAGALAEIEKGRFAVVPGKPEQSELYKRLVTSDKSDKMPPAKSNKSLTPAQIDLFRRWILDGAEYQGHWAFLPPRKSPVPAVKNAAWVRTPIDAFLLAGMERDGLAPSPEADRITLLRRLSFDLTGLPPTPEEADAFVADKDPAALEKAADRLLASPHYGERMALFWLDQVRFADSRGYHSDNPRKVAPYRDYVIRAFNDNLKFDQFTLEQLAGDLLPSPTLAQRIASGYNKLNQTTEEGGAQAREYEAKTVADRVRSVSGVWLGATMGCCECHDHKYDPYTAKDFYRMGAFFADIQESAIGDRDPGILAPSDAEAATLAAFDARIAALKKTLETPTPELARGQAEWEKTALDAFPWQVVAPSKLASEGSELVVEEDGSILVKGGNPAKDVHTVHAALDLKGATGFRLEVIQDSTVAHPGPGRSPAGNFVLTRFRVQRAGKDLPFVRAKADHQQDDWTAASALDPKGAKGWAILPQTGRDHEIIFEPKEKLDLAGPLAFVLEYKSPFGQHVAGRFRLSVTDRERPSDVLRPPAEVVEALRKPAAERTPEQSAKAAAHYRSLAPELRAVREGLARAEEEKAAFVKTLRTSLVALPGGPRAVRVLPRGNWLDATGEVVTPSTPAFLPPLEGPGDRRATRLDLAKWITAPSNPLAARAAVNRFWKLFYGIGISKNLDDLGAQGEWPTQPELLDWLAVDFQESGWDVKRLVKLMVTSAAYRQTSTASKALKEKDPYNRKVARQSRFRLDAEFVRDNALAVSGLLVDKQGGESVFPYQPAGYWFHLNFPKRDWPGSKDENQWRRGVYTWVQRTFPHPSLAAFDAPSREEACMERPRSNIPQQALALLNDPTYVEAARKLAERTLREGGADRLGWMLRRVLTRKGDVEELKTLSGLFEKHLAIYKADPKAAQALIAVGQSAVPKDLDAAELAAWTSVARVLLNLHETITRL
jgi:hypothetical protein